MKRLLLAALLLVGCAGTPAHQVLTQTNAFYFWRFEYVRACGEVPTTPECKAWARDINEFETRVQEAEAARARGGDLPLQLKALKVAAKKAGRTKP